MKVLDVNKDGVISFKEYVALYKVLQDRVYIVKLYLALFLNFYLNLKKFNKFREVFDIFDRNKNGRIEANELQNALKALGKPHTDAILAETVLIFKIYMLCYNHIE